MPEGALLLGFVIASLVVLLTPGPGVMYVVARSVAQGPRAGLVSVVGLGAGALVHVVATAAGLSAVLLASSTVFGLVKILGAGYLIYLGVSTLLARADGAGTGDAPPAPLSRVLSDGALVSVLNPKIAVFFLAYLPQFVDPTRGAVAQQVLVLGCLYVALALLTDGAYALLASRLRQWFGTRLLREPLTRYLSGGIYIGLGVTTLLTGRRGA